MSQIKAPSSAVRQQDPALVEFFRGSRKSYDDNVDNLIDRLDAAAAYTRAHRNKISEAQPITLKPVLGMVVNNSFTGKLIVRSSDGTLLARAIAALAQKSNPQRGLADKKEEPVSASSNREAATGK